MIKRLLRTRSYERAELDDQVHQTYLLSSYLTKLTCCSSRGSLQLNSLTLTCDWNNQLNCPHIHFPPWIWLQCNFSMILLCVTSELGSDNLCLPITSHSSIHVGPIHLIPCNEQCPIPDNKMLPHCQG